MKRLLLAIALFLPIGMAAQDLEFGARASVGAEYRIVKGLHVLYEEEIRSTADFSTAGAMTNTLSSIRTTVGITYKPIKYLKIGIGYTLINPWKASKEIELDDGSVGIYRGFWAPRHRAYLDVAGLYRLGDFQFSLKERLQFTHRTDPEMNEFQSTRDAFGLKSRASVKYRRFKDFQPSLSFEIRTALNDPWGSISGSAKTNKGGRTYYSYTHEGYTHVYNNRYRGILGADISLGRHHSLEPYVLFDYISDYEIDTNGDGTRLFTATTGYVDAFMLSLGLSYVFNF